MRHISRRFETIRASLLMLFFLISLTAAGCTSRTVVRDVDTYPEGRAQYSTETTVDADLDVDDDGGVISGVFDIIGDIIALPFRAVAGLFRLIF